MGDHVAMTHPGTNGAAPAAADPSQEARRRAVACGLETVDVDISEVAEAVAREVVGRDLGARVEDLDGTRPEPMLPDFTLFLPNGRRGVLEATTCTDAMVRRLDSRLTSWEGAPAPALSSSWHLYLDESTASPRDLLEEAGPLLDQVEAVDCHWFAFDGDGSWPHVGYQNGRVTYPHPPPEPMVALGRLGVVSAWAIQVSGPSRIRLFRRSSAATADSEAVVQACEAEAGANAAKLAGVDDTYVERHLFIWVDVGARFDVEFSLSADTAAAGARPPTLPDGTTDVWVAAHALVGHAMRGRRDVDRPVVVWHARAGGPWRQFDVEMPEGLPGR